MVCGRGPDVFFGLRACRFTSLTPLVSPPSLSSDAVPFRPSAAAAAAAATAAAAAARPPSRRPPYTRFIALQVFYLGWEYAGFTSQGKPDDGTAEAALLGALRRTGLIPRLESGYGGGGAGDASTSTSPSFFPPDYSRCGRTDRGVSGVGQVVALRIRSRLGPEGVPVVAPPASFDAGAAAATSATTASHAAGGGGQPGAIPDPDAEEIDYVRTLNGALPPTIRVTAWAPAPPGFSARFSAAWRRYRYFLVEETRAGRPGDPSARGLDLAAMRQAAAYLVGSHDFRNFCRADIPAVTNFRRAIKDLTIHRVGDEEDDEGVGEESEDDAAARAPRGPADPPPPPRLRLPAGLVPPGQEGVVIQLTGAAFLWHQVRYIVAVLAMVGRGQEDPRVVKALLDTGPGGAFPSKPQYAMAPDRPLLFCGAGFCGGGGDLAWRRGGGGGAGGEYSSALAGVRELLREHTAGALLLAAVAAQLEEEETCAGGAPGSHHPSSAPPPPKRARHRPLAARPRDPPLEVRLAAKGLTLAAGEPSRPVTAGVDGMEIGGL